MRKLSRDERRQSPSAILATPRTDEGRQLDMRRVRLTEGTIVPSEVLDTAARPTDDVRRRAHINAALETGIENPLDAAIVAAGEAAGLTPVGLTKIDEIPYDFVRRRLTIVVSEAADPGHHQIVTKGAFAEVPDSCTAFECDGAEGPLDEAARANLETVFTATETTDRGSTRTTPTSPLTVRCQDAVKAPCNIALGTASTAALGSVIRQASPSGR